MNRKIALSAFSIVAAVAVLGGAVYAQFVSQASSTGNTFSVGNADLQIAPDVTGNPGAFGATMPGFSGTNLFPGYDQTFTFWLKNNSSSAIDLDPSVTLQDNGGGNATLKGALSITFACTDTAGTGTLVTAGPQSYTAWVGGNGALGSLSPTETAKCTMNVKLPPSGADGALNGSGASVNFDALFNATQNVTPTPSPTSTPTPTP